MYYQITPEGCFPRIPQPQPQLSGTEQEASFQSRQHSKNKDIQLPTGIEFTNINFKSDITTQSTREHKQQTGHQKKGTGCDGNHKKEVTLNDMPNEVMAIIWSYLTFTEKSRIGRTNNRSYYPSELRALLINVTVQTDGADSRQFAQIIKFF